MNQCKTLVSMITKGLVRWEGVTNFKRLQLLSALTGKKQSIWQLLNEADEDVNNFADRGGCYDNIIPNVIIKLIIVLLSIQNISKFSSCLPRRPSSKLWPISWHRFRI